MDNDLISSILVQQVLYKSNTVLCDYFAVGPGNIIVFSVHRTDRCKEILEERDVPPS